MYFFNISCSLAQDATTDLEKKIKKICDICKARQQLAEQERALTSRMYVVQIAQRM